ncbi:hypothetical protein LCGC14_2460890, partial [marine sediment metagenome]
MRNVDVKRQPAIDVPARAETMT